MLVEHIDHSCRIADIVGGIQAELFEPGVLANQIFDRILEHIDQTLQCSPVGALLHIQHGIALDTHLLGDRQGMLGRASIRIVINGDIS